jgi:hypothetical protein
MGITSNVNNPHFINHAPTNQNMVSPTFRAAQNGAMQRNFIDPYGKVTSKAKKIIENVERQRQTPADPRICSTGGSFDQEITEFNKIKADQMSPKQILNNTTQNFY